MADHSRSANAALGWIPAWGKNRFLRVELIPDKKISPSAFCFCGGAAGVWIGGGGGGEQGSIVSLEFVQDRS